MCMNLVESTVGPGKRLVGSRGMILWTIQHESAYERMLQTGTLRSDENHIVHELFRTSYEWMAVQMAKRIGEAPSGVKFPVWAWYQWEGKRKRPDMRMTGRWSVKGTPIVLLTIDVPDECVLLSDFEDWHMVLNDGVLIFPYEDVVYSKEEQQRSWEKIFDYECSYDSRRRNEELTTQACMWEIKAEWVVKAERFVAR